MTCLRETFVDLSIEFSGLVFRVLGHAERRASVESSLREVIFQVLRCVNESKDHIPPSLSSDIASFPFEITVPR